MSGNLTLLGKTQPLTLKANQFACYQSPYAQTGSVGGDFEGTVDRTAHGMNYGVDWGFCQNVRVVIQVKPSSSNQANALKRCQVRQPAAARRWAAPGSVPPAALARSARCRESRA